MRMLGLASLWVGTAVSGHLACITTLCEPGGYVGNPHRLVVTSGLLRLVFWRLPFDSLVVLQTIPSLGPQRVLL